MSKKPITHTVLILDQSGSMECTRSAAVQGYNEQVQQAKLNSKDQDIFCSLVTFNGEVFEHVWNEHAEKLNEARVEDFVTEGSTAMRDAIGYTINKLLATTDHADENVSYLVVIISDGEENASKHFRALNDFDRVSGRKDELKELIQEVQRTKRWTFTYMGCDERYVRQVSEDTSIPIANCGVWSNATEKHARHAQHQNKSAMGAFYCARSAGATGSANVYSPCALKMADFTQPDDSVVDLAFDVSNGPNKSIITAGSNMPLNTSNLVNDTPIAVVNTGSATPFSNHSPVSWAK